MLLLGSEMMLRYLAEIEAAMTFRNAIVRTHEAKRVRAGDGAGKPFSRAVKIAS